MTPKFYVKILLNKGKPMNRGTTNIIIVKNFIMCRHEYNT